MIRDIYVIDTKADFRLKLDELGLPFKDCWWNYIFLDKANYYRLVLFDNGEYGLFTQSQLPIVQAHSELNSADWRDYKPYADRDYREMRPNGVEAGTKLDNSWTSIRKEEFRKSKEWRNFKENIIKWNTKHDNYIYCEDCKNNILPELIEVHHIFPEQYDVLERKKFMLLCHDCHQVRTKRGE